MAILYVKKDGSGNSTTIQGAIQAAAIGDTVQIEAGTFDENIDLWKGVNLVGAGMTQTIITGNNRTAPASKTFTWALGATTLTATAGQDLSGYEIGRIVTASGIPSNSRLVSKTSTTITISAATTAAATTARAVAQAVSGDATIRVRGGTGSIKDMKIVGFDNANPATEYAAIYLRNTGLGSNPANGWEISYCEIQAAGEYAILTDSAAGLGNFNIHHNKITGQTFVGANPASGNQFSVWNVPRQLVVVQGVNTGVNKFENNEISGITGGVTTLGVNSWNNAVTFDPIGSIVQNNFFNGTYGTGVALRCRGLNSTVLNNKNMGPLNAGFYLLPNWATATAISVGTMVLSSAKYYVCTQAHTSDATNAPTGASGASYWSEITLEQVNASGTFGIYIQDIGTNLSGIDPLITMSQASAGAKVQISFDKGILKLIPSVAGDATFSQEANWQMVGIILKHESSAKRMTSGFKDFAATRSMKLGGGLSGEKFMLHKIILSNASKQLLVVKRSEVEDPTNYDITLK